MFSKKLTQNECILTKLLDCGYADLEILEDIEYDLDDILQKLVDNNCLSFNSLLHGVFSKGQQELTDAIENHLSDLNGCINEINNDDITSEITDIKTLNPEEDMSWYLNYLDTHVYLEKSDTYKKYFADEIDCIENNMGFEFGV